MHIQIRRNALLQGLQAVIGVVERRQTLPILGNVLLDVQEDRLKLTATDLEMQLESEADVGNLRPGRTTVAARKLHDICRALPEGAELDVEVQNARMTVKSGRSRFVLATLPAEDFPSFERVGSEQRYELGGKELKALLASTQFAMAQQDVRYYLNGMLMEFGPSYLRSVATDGHRLSLGETPLEGGPQKPVLVIVPRKTVMELQRLLDTAGTVSIGLGGQQIDIELDGIRICSKLIDGRFPDYERVIPDKAERIVVMDRERLRAALARVAILSNEKFRGVRLRFEPGSLSIQSQNPEQEEAEEQIEIGLTGDPMEIGFNVVYLMDALSVIPTSEVVLEMRGPDGSGLLRANSDAPHRYVVMPMRL